MREKHKKIGKMSVKSNEPIALHKGSMVSGIDDATDQRKLGSTNSQIQIQFKFTNSILQVVSRRV